MSGRKESVETATPGGGVTSDDDVDGYMTKTDTYYSLLCSELSTPDDCLAGSSAHFYALWTEIARFMTVVLVLSFPDLCKLCV